MYTVSYPTNNMFKVELTVYNGDGPRAKAHQYTVKYLLDTNTC